ncbi:MULTISPECIES: energy-coupling factor ABC transporter ATP-binding protein [Brevibacillus]|uniref:energy-coupling factor ABC transporter ATP-binding protein n=1 Tax=Brevibacillus TaxID=55080 RepID=UPI00156B7183|nr:MULTISPECIES: ABC transporter ATP-binding protein [Brevibacillus]MBU8714582.1 ATP-binding cassette domain-containing protein [Brevibacillus parabrevis]UED67791.1 energy-coupling factor ABC transporter ATP-binding protein [Brevibacillus sp. HD3.3A]
MSFISLKNITFAYPNGHTAVENVSMEIGKGETVAIVGQNGAGKTTAVKLMNGLLKPTKGDVIIDDWNTKEHTTAQISRKVGYVFQNPDDQIFHSDVYSEVEFGPKNLGLSVEQTKENVMKAAKLAGIEPYLQENPYNLPYSMRKFVTMAAVVAMDCDVIILDEPTAGQDRQGMQRISSLIAALKSEGKTVITITHDMEFVVQNFERVIVMAHKNVVADTNKRDIFWNHAILEESMLKQPHISRLSHTLGLPKQILTIEEFVETML